MFSPRGSTYTASNAPLRLTLVVAAAVLASQTVETFAFLDFSGKKMTSSALATGKTFLRPGSTSSSSSSKSKLAGVAEGSTLSTSDLSMDAKKSAAAGEETDDQTSLTFRGEVSFNSSSLPHPESAEHLVRFFQTPASRNLMISGGGERPCTELEVTPELLNDWRSKCEMLGACPPDEGDSVMSITTPGLSFPGLTVKNLAKIGTKYVEDAPPRHEFVLLSNDSEASGLPPVVWLYNRLTGGGKKDSSSSSTNIKSLSTVSYEKKNDSVVFQTKASLTIGMKFPKLLMKALGDKSKAEQVGANSIRNTLDKDVAQSMTALEKAYLRFLDNINHL